MNTVFHNELLKEPSRPLEPVGCWPSVDGMRSLGISPGRVVPAVGVVADAWAEGKGGITLGVKAPFLPWLPGSPAYA